MLNSFNNVVQHICQVNWLCSNIYVKSIRENSKKLKLSQVSRLSDVESEDCKPDFTTSAMDYGTLPLHITLLTIQTCLDLEWLFGFNAKTMKKKRVGWYTFEPAASDDCKNWESSLIVASFSSHSRLRPDMSCSIAKAFICLTKTINSYDIKIFTADVKWKQSHANKWS